MKIEYIECDCHTELLQLEFENEEEVNEEIDARFLYISFYNLGVNDFKRPLRSKLRHIWYIITKGTPWSDQIVLRKEERLKLTAFLNSLNEEDNVSK